MSDEPLLPWGHLDPSLVLAMRAAIDGQIASAGGRQNGYAAQACAAASQSYAASLRGQVETLQAELAEAKREAWQEGFDTGENMAHMWGHVDHWENWPQNPYDKERQS